MQVSIRAVHSMAAARTCASFHPVAKVTVVPVLRTCYCKQTIAPVASSVPSRSLHAIRAISVAFLGSSAVTELPTVSTEKTNSTVVSSLCELHSSAVK